MAYLMVEKAENPSGEKLSGKKITSCVQNLLHSGEPCILNGKDNKDDDHIYMYTRFCLNDLLEDLFCKKAGRPPLTGSEILPKSKKERLEFLMPPGMLCQIREKKKNGEPYITEEGRNNDYVWFFRPSGENKKIAGLIHEMFKDGGKDFLIEVRKHIVSSFSAVDFSANPKLKECLLCIGDNIIVPKQESVPANGAFHTLLDIGDHASLSTIVANFLISALLGLVPVKNESNDSLYKTYLLNGYGMEYIWTPDLISTRYEELHSIRQSYKNGDYRAAYQQIKKWISDYEISASQEELALAYQILGFCLYHLSSSNNKRFEGRQKEGIVFLEKCASTGVADLVVNYFLYDYFKKDDGKKADAYLKKAFEQNYAKAVVEATNLFLGGKKICDDITEEVLLEKINIIINNERKNSFIDVSECLYLRGLFSKRHGNVSDAAKDFENAAKKGNEKARKEISRRKRMERQAFPSFSGKANAPCCFSNTLTGNNLAVISTFPDNEWSLYTSGKIDSTNIHAIKVSDIDDFIKIQHLENFEFCRPRIVFLFMSESEDKNLNECLILLDKLFNIACESSESQKWCIIDAIDIYVSAKYETASMLIDSNISDMGNDIYFKVHIVDEARDTAHKLLCDAPLFLPALNNVKKENASNVILFGSTETNYCFIKESVACAYLGDACPITITLLGKDAVKLERRFHQECPGVYNNDPHLSCIRPTFIQCNIEEEDFPSYIYGDKHDNDPDNEIVQALNNGNYFIVDFAGDLENIRFAAELRTWLLRSRGTFDRAPFIGVKCANDQNSYLASHLPLSGQAAGNSYFNKYDLFPLGVARQMYSYGNMIEKPVLNDLALQIHKSYSGDTERLAENDFYSYSYNADSSLLTAIGLCYRFFAAGAVFKSKELYLNFGAFNSVELLSDFVNSMESKSKRAALAPLEQSRWNGFMLSRGWESANSIQVQAYKNQSTESSHKHTLAKLHPFIREWGDLNDHNDDLLRILDMLESKFDYDRRPQETTMKSINDTVRFFETSIRDDEKTR